MPRDKGGPSAKIAVMQSKTAGPRGQGAVLKLSAGMLPDARTARVLRVVALATLTALGCGTTADAREPASWHPAVAPLMTRWAAEVSPTNALPEYPRPQLVRPDWLN